MKIRFTLLSLFAALLVAGCGKNSTGSSATVTSAPSAPATATAPDLTPVASAKGAARTIEITANDAMKFSVTAIEAKVGEEIKIVLTNVGTLPKEAMGHNLVLLKPGSDLMAYAAAASTARDKEFIPESHKDQVLGHTALLGPRKSDEFTVKFTAAGEYPYLCSFPAHLAVGMKGVITVK